MSENSLVLRDYRKQGAKIDSLEFYSDKTYKYFERLISILEFTSIQILGYKIYGNMTDEAYEYWLDIEKRTKDIEGIIREDSISSVNIAIITCIEVYEELKADLRSIPKHIYCPNPNDSIRYYYADLDNSDITPMVREFSPNREYIGAILDSVISKLVDIKNSMNSAVASNNNICATHPTSLPAKPLRSDKEVTTIYAKLNKAGYITGGALPFLNMYKGESIEKPLGWVKKYRRNHTQIAKLALIEMIALLYSYDDLKANEKEITRIAKEYFKIEPWRDTFQKPQSEYYNELSEIIGYAK